MRRTIGFLLGGFLLGALLFGGCAVYTEPLPPAAGIYVAPPPAVVVAPRPWWVWGGEWHHRWR